MKKSYKSSDYRSGADETDPCVAAESRMKKSPMSSRSKRLVIIFAIVLLLLVVVVALLIVVLTMKHDDESIDYEEHQAQPIIKPNRTKMQADQAINLNPHSVHGLYANERPYIVPILLSDPLKKPLIYGGTPHQYRAGPFKPPATSTTKSIKTPPTTIPMKVTRRPILIPATAPPPKPTSTSTSTTTTTTTTTKPWGPVHYSEQPTVSVKVQSTYYSGTDSEPAEKLTDVVKKNCLEHLGDGLGSGIYPVSPDGREPFDVYCDMETEGGGWAVIQKRVDGSISFYNNTFIEYEQGFGKLTGSHWLGLSQIHRLAPFGREQGTLRIELRGDTCKGPSCSQQPDGLWWGEWDFALYDANSAYRLYISEAQLRGNLSMPRADGKGEWEKMSNGRPFTTMDRDNDSDSGNCAQLRLYGGWWHKDCTRMALNGRYGDTYNKFRYMVYFYETPYRPGSPSASYYLHPKETKMMLRP